MLNLPIRVEHHAAVGVMDKAVRQPKHEVILNSDGTWVYAEKAPKPAQVIQTNKKKFEKPKDSSFLVKSTRNKSACWINSAAWSFKKAQDNAAAEYQFQLKGKDLYGMLITKGSKYPWKHWQTPPWPMRKALPLMRRGSCKNTGW